MQLSDNLETAELRWRQERMDAWEIPDHYALVRNLPKHKGAAVVCHCGYIRFLATPDLAWAVSKHHNRTGEEV